MDSELSLTELIDIDMLQYLQDAFADMTGMAALTTDQHGNAITGNSNFTDFCTKYTRSSAIGCKLCIECDKRGAEETLKNGVSCSYYCHAGLVDFAAPIMAHGKIFGSFIGGQVLTEAPDLEKFRKKAIELEIDPDEYVEAVKKVKIVSKETVDKAAHFLFVIANVLSGMAYRGYELHEQNIEIEKASHMKSDFLANMSHEIRTPMNAVLGMADMALREEMSPAAKEYIHQIKTAGKNLLVIINDILDFSKIESGKMNIIEVAYEPMSIINDLASIVNSRIGNKNIEFTMDICPDMPQTLFGDSVRIHQVILNMLTNAVKFTQQGEVHLKLECERKSDDMVLMKAEISDTGIGIKKEDFKKLFNSFQQVDSKRNRNIEGTGLGLVITKQLLTLMNGTLSVTSEYNKGSTFSCELPQKIINPTPAVPILDHKLSVAVYISNVFVKNQIMRDLNRIKADIVDLSKNDSIDHLDVDMFIIEKDFFTSTMQDFVEKDPEIRCIVVANYDSPNDIKALNVHVVRKPVYSLNLYNAMGLSDITLYEGANNNNDNFTFVAPEAHVLIVDDNAVNLTVAKGLIEPLNMQVDTAQSAAEAIEKVGKLKYDLIFMDHMMPEVDGVETTHIIRQMLPGYADVPIIALTANAIGGTKEMFLNEGMNDFVAKPIEVNDIVAKLRKWLPQEKILPADMAAKPVKPAKSEPEINIDGLNVKNAIKLLGSEELYMEVLKEYYCAIDKKYDAILTHWKEQKWRDYTIEVHALKSTSRQIGAEELSALAADLEHAGNEGNIDLINEKTDQLLDDYLKLKELLKPIFPNEGSGSDKQKTATAEKTAELLEMMHEALENFDVLQMDDVVEKMSEYVYPENQTELFEQIKKAADESDIDKCYEIISEWRTEI